MPEGAAADPGSALTVLAQSYGSQLIGVMQGAAGNAETDRELATLQEAKTVAATAKTDRDSIDQMNDGQKLEKFGNKGGGDGGGGGGAGAGGADPSKAPPPGVADPSAATNFHGQRAAQLTQLAAQHASVAGSLGAAAATPGLAPELAGFLSAGAGQSQAQQASLASLAQVYQGIAGAMAGSEFTGGIMPGKEVPALYEQRAATIQSIVQTVDRMTAEYSGALAAETAKATACDAQVAALQAQIAEAQAKKGEKKDDKKEAAAPAPAPSPAPGAKGGADKKEAAGKGGNEAGGGKGAEAKAEAAVKKDASSAMSGAAGGDAAKADPTPALKEQITAQQAKKTAIQANVRANEGLVSTMKSYREQMQSLLSAYQRVLGITPPQGKG